MGQASRCCTSCCTGARSRRPARATRRAVEGLDVIIDERLDAADDPVGELERLMREALGPWAYRLDAWYTGVAAWRLENKRQARPRGIQVGAYGWLVDVKPRGRRRLAGLRARPLAVARDERGHPAQRLVGVRRGPRGRPVLRPDPPRALDRRRRPARARTSGGSLGARFERGLQDAGLATYRRVPRSSALEAVGSQAPPNAIVDGLLLARAREEADDLTTRRRRRRGESTRCSQGAPAGDAAGSRGRSTRSSTTWTPPPTPPSRRASSRSRRATCPRRRQR